MSAALPKPNLAWNRGRLGQIARLPRHIRDKINQLMDDGLMYADILKELGPDAAHLTTDCLKRWRKSGHARWLLDRERVEKMNEMADAALRLVLANKDKAIEEASCQIAASQIYAVLMDYNYADLKTALDDNPEFYTRLTNVLATISNRSLDFEQRRDALAAQKEKIKEALDTANQRGMTPEAMDEFKRTLNMM